MPQAPTKPDREAWVATASGALRHMGSQALKAEPSERGMKADDAPFQSCSRDLDELRDAMIACRSRLTDDGGLAPVGLFDSPPKQKLAVLMHGVAKRRSPPSKESLMESGARAWGQGDPVTRKLLQEIDDLRLAHLKELLAQCGVPVEKQELFAVLIYSAGLGLQLLPGEDAACQETAMMMLANRAMKAN